MAGKTYLEKWHLSHILREEKELIVQSGKEGIELDTFEGLKSSMRS